MKRGLVLSLAALALVVGNAAVKAADIDVSLNLRYTDPANPAEGGRWFLMAKTNVAGANTGLAGLNVYLTNINSTGIVWGNPTAVGSGVAAYPVVTGATLGANVQTVGNTPFNFADGNVVNVVYGQDLVTKTTTIGEGTGTPGVLAQDPLRNPAWANSTLLMSGTFGGVRPAFTTYNGNSADGTLYNGSGNIAAGIPTISTTVRGDSVASLGLNTPANAGLLRGDSDRDGLVTLANDIFPAVGQVGQPAPKGWGDGDWDNDGLVTLANDIFPAVGLVGQPAPPAPQISAIPEPASMALAAVAGLSVVLGRRKRS